MKLFYVLLLLLFVGGANAIDEPMDIEYDSEIEDDDWKNWMDELKQEGNEEDDELFEKIFESMRNEEDMQQTEEVGQENMEMEEDGRQVEENDKRKDWRSPGPAVEKKDEDTRQSLKNFLDAFTKYMEDKNHSVAKRSISAKRTKCPNLRKYKKTNVKFSFVNYELGRIVVAHFTCDSGFHLRKSVPQYEVCGKATKYRWTYELRGKKFAAEKCVKGEPTPGKKICTTKQCFTSAAYYMNKIDFTVKPCDDFFKFACGRWMKETPVSPLYGKVLTYSLLRNNVIKDMAKLLGKPVSKKEIPAISKAKKTYQACMDKKRINQLDSKPLLNFLKGKMQWPILDENWDENQFDLETTWGNLRALHNDVLMKFKVSKDNGNVVLQLWKGRMAIPTSYYTNWYYADQLQAYKNLMFDTAMMLGGSSILAFRDVQRDIEFEKELAEMKRYDLDYFSSKTIREMNAEFPSINWLKLFKQMCKSHPITLDTKVQVWNTIFIHDLVNLLARTSKRTIQNYMMWRIVKHRILNLSTRFEQRYLKYKNAMYGTTSLPSREHKCAKYLMLTLKLPTGKMYVDVYFKPSKKSAALQMFKNIRKGFIELLDSEVTWMDKKTKDYARKKAKAIKPYIGYDAHYYENATYINEHMKQLSISSTDYFGNVLHILDWISQTEFKTIGSHYNVHVFRFLTRPTMVNAFYTPTKNAIAMPAGELQYPFYWGNSYPWSFQYGGVGTILGHELTHGFDNMGRRYGKDGYLKNWWSESSLKEFKKRTKCMVNQYNNYYWPTAGEFLNGKKTLGENIADNGGIRESYKGYQNWLKSNNKTSEDLEPTTGFTNDQMFFIGFANVRCAKYTPKKARYEIGVDVHSPGRYRVIGSLQNFDKFSQAFNCPVGSFMNPENKCIIW